MAGNGNGEFSFGNGTARNGLAKIQTHEKKNNGICHDDSGPPVKAQTIDELHSLQKKRSAPTTPIKGTQGAFTPTISEEERQKQQLQSIRYICYCTHASHTIKNSFQFLANVLNNYNNKNNTGKIANTKSQRGEDQRCGTHFKC